MTADTPNATSNFKPRLEVLAGRTLVSLSRPGGRDRDVLRARFETGPNWILSRRPKPESRARETEMLKALAPIRTPRLPQLLGQLGDWIITSDLGRTRLSVALYKTRADARWPMIETALLALLELQAAVGDRGRLDDLPLIELSPGDLIHMARGPERTRRLFGLSTEAPAPEALLRWLKVENPGFVKWDARAANIVLGDDGAPGLIDFEYCCRRHGAEDLAWLLCDEALNLDLSPYLSRIEALIDRHRPSAAADWHKRLNIFAALQAAMRLRVIHRDLIRKGWTPLREVIGSDLVGAHPDLARQLARNGALFAVREPETRPLVEMFAELEQKITDARENPMN